MESKFKQDMYSVGQTAAGLMLITLVIAGIGGTIYKVISPDGWVAQAFGRSMSAGVAALGSLMMIAGLAWFSRGWSATPERNRLTDLLLYTFAAAGLIYLGKLWLKGSV
jgi:hypothetical protein